MNNWVVKVQDLNGNWFEAKRIQAVSDNYRQTVLEEAQFAFPGKRIRIETESGQLVDLG